MESRANLEQQMRLWQQHRPAILDLGERLWRSLSQCETIVAVHGRDLKPASEGIGFQFQFSIAGDFYDGTVKAGYYVIQIQLIRQKTSMAWVIDTMPILENVSSSYILHEKRSRAFAYRDFDDIRLCFGGSFRRDVAHFFEQLQSETPIAGCSIVYQNDKST